MITEKRTGMSFTALDVETTGLSPDRHRIIELGAVKYIDGAAVQEFNSFIRIDSPVPANITALTGIDDGMLADAPDEGAVIGRFLRFADTPVILGHNLRFDYGFVKTAAVRQGYEFEKAGIDTLALARRFHPELESRNLTAMCGCYQIDPGRSHRAFCDAKAAAELYLRLYERFFRLDGRAFAAGPMEYRVKKQEPMTAKQKKYLLDLAKYHKIEVKQSLETMTKSEASRLIDSIILNYGKMGRY